MRGADAGAGIASRKILFVDHVLRAHLAGAQPTRADPAADRLGVPSKLGSNFWHREHVL